MNYIQKLLLQRGKNNIRSACVYMNETSYLQGFEAGFRFGFKRPMIIMTILLIISITLNFYIMKNQIKGHQGDVQFKQTILPPNAVKVKHRPIALGEVSGHQHVLTGDVELFEMDGKTFAVVGSDGAFLQHVQDSDFTETMYTKKKLVKKADHKPVDLPAGTYEMFIQNQYNPFKKVFEQVKD